MNLHDEKIKVAMLSVLSNSMLIILKVIAGILSGSVSIISEAIHSSMDLLASIIAFASVKISSKPADENHPYGHGKFENVSGVIEGILIFIAAFLIIKEAINKIINPSEIHDTTIAIVVMLVSSIVNFAVSKKLYKVAKEQDSIALEADALHLKTDVYTSFGVAGGLLLLNITKIRLLDPVVAILVSCLIIKEAFGLCKNAFAPLVDEKLSYKEEEEIKKIIEKYKTDILDFHKLRTRKSGNIRYVDCHIVVNENLTVKEAHKLTEKIEKDIEEILKNTDVNIHIEPK